MRVPFTACTNDHQAKCGRERENRPWWYRETTLSSPFTQIKSPMTCILRLLPFFRFHIVDPLKNCNPVKLIKLVPSIIIPGNYPSFTQFTSFVGFSLRLLLSLLRLYKLSRKGESNKTESAMTSSKIRFPIKIRNDALSIWYSLGNTKLV